MAVILACTVFTTCNNPVVQPPAVRLNTLQKYSVSGEALLGRVKTLTETSFFY